MTEDRLIAAFGRLEQAVARFEARLPGRLEIDASPAAAAATEIEAAAARYARLEEKHETLRGQAAAVVARLDRLLETGRADAEAPASAPPEPTREE